ncbi:hypothetical protein LINPERHAP1_LOCUS1404, partial [Linum perenne]
IILISHSVILSLLHSRHHPRTTLLFPFPIFLNLISKRLICYIHEQEIFNQFIASSSRRKLKE